MKNKRILTYSEFDGEYGSTGKRGIQAGNDQAAIDLFKNAPNELDEPTLSDDNNKIDSINSKPATNQIKTDYESTPQSPDGPIAGSDDSVEKASIDEIKAKFKKSMENKANRKMADDTEAPDTDEEDTEEVIDDIDDTEEIETKSKKKLTPKQKEELRRENEGEY